jgi:hypothetical protein
VDVELDVNSVDLSHIQNSKHVQKLQTLVDNYKPEQTRDVGIRMKLLLTDDEPINSRPRRLAPAEKDEVNAQIDEWLKVAIIRPRYLIMQALSY